MLSKKLLNKYLSFKTRLVLLYGSRARGDYTDESDVDVLVVADLLPEDPRRSFSMLFSSRYPSVIPLGMNTKVFIKKLKEGSTFVLEALEDGKILYADKEFLNDVKKLFMETRKRYLRKGKTWIQLD